MSERRTVVWLAGSAPDPGKVRTEAIDASSAIGLAAGDDAAGLSKRAPNEDSLAMVRQGDLTLAIVADAHFGPSSSERIVGDLIAALADRDLEQLSGAELAAALRRCSLAWRSAGLAERDSETTVLCALIAPQRVSWVSVGDSYLFRLRPDRPVRRLNRVSSRYLGSERPESIDVEVSSAELAPGDVVLVATDGIDADASGLELSEVASTVLAYDRPIDAISALIGRASFAAQGGGGDNLALVCVRV